MEEHEQQLRQVFSIFSKNNFYAKFSKCVFAVKSIQYLRHIISNDGVSVDSEKIQALRVGLHRIIYQV